MYKVLRVTNKFVADAEVLPIPKVVLKRPIRVLELAVRVVARYADSLIEFSSASFRVVKMNEMIADQKEQEETAKPSELHGAKREPFSWVLTRCRANRQKW